MEAAAAAMARNDGEDRDKVVEAPLAAGALPVDMLREILLRLPADALCRFRLVCRPWRSLTSAPSFAMAHAARHPLIAGLDRSRNRSRNAVHIVDMSGRVLRRIPIHPRHLCMDLTTAQPGLVCVSPHSGPSFTLDPVAGVATAMPRNKGSATGVECQSILGLVPATGHHKVLRFQLDSNNAGLEQRCLVLTLGDQRWRAGPRPPVIVDWHESGDRVVVDGVAYFLLTRFNLRHSANLANLDPDSIAAFDLATEKWRPTTMVGPLTSSLLTRHGDTKLSQHKYRNQFRKYRIQFRLAQLDGCLVAVHHYQDCSMNLWFLVDADKGLWANKYSVQCETRCDMSHLCVPPHPLVILHDGRIVFRLNGGIIRAYDPRTTMWADLAHLRGYPVLHHHEGSLLLCSSNQA